MGSVGSLNGITTDATIKNLIYTATSSPGDLTISERRILEDYVEQNSKAVGLIYRGLTITDAKLNKLKVGDLFDVEARLTSWTNKLRNARDFATMSLDGGGFLGANAVILKNPNGKGIDIKAISKFQGESEILVNDKNNYIITKIETKSTYIYDSWGKRKKIPLTVISVKH